MAQLTIVSHDGSAAIVLPKNLLQSLGLDIGDTVDATLSDRQLVLRALDDAERCQLMKDLTTEVLNQRSDAYHRLA